MLKPKYTMNEFNLPKVAKCRTSVHQRALRTLLTAHLPHLHPNLLENTRNTIMQRLNGKDADRNGMTEQDRLQISCLPILTYEM